MMLTDFRYRVSNAALSLQLGHVHRITTRDHTRAEQRLMLQSARLVLLPADSLLTDACLLDIALDAIVSGAIPVMFGTPRGAHSLLHALDRVHSAADLVALQARYRTAWLAERRSRRLMCDVMRDHILTAAHRTALLGMDPFEAAFDTPPISTVLISKRPHLLAQCLAAFRRQSWANKELVLILNTGALPGDMPDLAPNEHVMSLPVTANIGECLNRAIAFSTGRYWAKMDDDDTYADTYLEETVHAYRASQADVVGRASVLFYFQRHDETHSRFSPAPPTRELLTSRYVSGATLSGDTRWLDLPFSPRDRNSMDTHWLHAVMSGGHRVLCADMTSLIVFRSSKDSDHTWQLTRSAATMRNFTCLAHGDVKDRMALYR
jgi:hypothetical protein